MSENLSVGMSNWLNYVFLLITPAGYDYERELDLSGRMSVHGRIFLD